MTIDLIVFINAIILFLFVCLTMGSFLLFLTSISEVVSTFKTYEITDVNSLIDLSILPSVTIIMSAFNEGSAIRESIMSILNSLYKNVHIIIVNDGSTDDMLSFLISEYALQTTEMNSLERFKTAKVINYYISEKYPNITVIDKKHSNVGDSLNAGLNICRTPLFATVDADTLLEPDALSKIIFSFLSRPNTVAVGGGVYVLNACTFKDGKILSVKMPHKIVAAMQMCEYLRSFMFGRTGWSPFGGALSFAGAFTLFQTNAVRQAAGFDLENFAQDFEIILRLHTYMRQRNKPYNIHFCPNAIAWTDVPDTLRGFWGQRERWMRGMLKSTLPYKRMFFNASYKLQGYFSYPYYLLFEVFGGLIEFSAYLVFLISWAVGFIHFNSVMLYIISAWGFMVFLTIGNAFLFLFNFNRYQQLADPSRLFILVFIETFGFRQFHVLARFYGLIIYIIHRIQGKKI
ncbi:MAG: glycosyltransferase [Gammaproteobacteria bacterium]